MNKKLLFLSLLIFISMSLITYLCLSNYIYKNEKFKLTVLHNNLVELTKHEFETAIFSEHAKFFLFSNYKKQTLNSSQEFQKVILTDQNTLIINNPNYQLTLDLQEFKEYIDKILPSYVIYKVLLNKDIIAEKDLKAKQYIHVTSPINISDIVNLSIDLGIDENSEYYQEQLNKFNKKYLNIIAFFSLLIILCLVYYLKIKNKFALKNQNSKQILENLQHKNLFLVQHIEVLKKLEYLFIASIEYAQINTCQISAVEIASDLENYFFDNKANVKIEHNIKAKHIEATCSKKNLYQLIFSLTNLLIAFMKGQSDEQKAITITLDKEQLIFEFESFSLDEEKMLYLAANVLSLPESFYLLDCHSLFQFLKDNNFKYSISILQGNNHRIEINILNQDRQAKNSKILKFRPGKDV